MRENPTSESVLDALLKQVESYGNKFDFSGEASIVLPALWRITNKAWKTFDDTTKERVSKAFRGASAKVFPKHSEMYAHFDEMPAVPDFLTLS